MLIIFLYTVLGVYGKFILCMLVIILLCIIKFKIKLNKVFSLVLIIFLTPNIFIDFSINNLNYDKNGLFIKNKLEKYFGKDNEYYYAMCPFISNVCYSIKKYGSLDALILSNQVKKLLPNYYIDDLGGIYFSSTASKREKYLDNKAITNTSYLYKTLFIPTSKQDMIIYNYNIAKSFDINEILEKDNKCELLLYGAQNGWNNYKEQLIKELENNKNDKCFKNINYVILNGEIENNKNRLIYFLKTGNINE